MKIWIWTEGDEDWTEVGIKLDAFEKSAAFNRMHITFMFRDGIYSYGVSARGSYVRYTRD